MLSRRQLTSNQIGQLPFVWLVIMVITLLAHTLKPLVFSKKLGSHPQQ